MANKVRFAVIGCGVISKFHAVSINEIENAELVACFDAYKPGAERFAAEYNVKAYDSLVFSADGCRICNPSLQTVWFDLDGVLYQVEPGQTLAIVDNGVPY